MWDLPFGYRLALVGAFLFVASAVEFALKRGDAVRWRGTVIIVAAAACGGLFGVVVDSITSSISPAYFAVGKGLGWGDDLARRARWLGLQAGSSAGVLVGCVLTWANFRVANRMAPLPIGRVVQTFGRPIGWGVLGAVVLGCGLALAIPVSFVRRNWGLADGDIGRFLTVWGAHTGLYVGGSAGLVGATLRVHRMRRV